VYVESIRSVAPNRRALLKPLRLDVDDDNLRGAGDARANDGVEPYTAGAEDDDCVAGAHVGGVQDGTSARDDPAAKQRRLGEREFPRYDSELILVDEGLFREAAQPEALEHRDRIAAQARGIGPPTQCRLGMSALKRPASQASNTRSTRLCERTHDVIAGADLPDIWPDCSNHPRNLVTEHRR
jgi:hypothetical protein